MTTYVLGWDGLDLELLDSYGMTSEFAAYVGGHEPLVNPVLGKPDTYEMWPSIITGVTPEQHGVELISDDGGASFESPLLQLGSTAVHRLLPTRTRVALGITLRNMGFKLSQKTPEWYEERGVSTVFDGLRSRAITVPNYVSQRDRELGLVDGWGAEQSSYLAVEAELDHKRVVYRPKRSLKEVEDWLVNEAHQKLAALDAAAREDYDLVWTWFSYIDTVGHSQPAVERDFGETDWQRRAYENALDMTREFESSLDPEDELLVVSDHGNRDGEHTMDAVVGGSTDVVTEAKSALDIRSAVEAVVSEAEAGAASADADTPEDTTAPETASEVSAELDD
ncbi:MAG: hypothetical protein ACOCT0_00685 [Halobacteriota archaeon]